MAQPLQIISQQLLSDSRVKLRFRVNIPGIYEYVPEYCAYSVDNGTNWYRCREVNKYGHSNDPLFVPQGGQGFIYVFEGPANDDLEGSGVIAPDMITRLTILKRDCEQTAPDVPDYWNPQAGTGDITGETGDPTGDYGGPVGEIPPPVRNPEEPPPPSQGGIPAIDPDGEIPSPGTPTGDDGSDAIPPGTGYPGYPGAPGEVDEPDSGTPNDPTPPSTPVQPDPGDDATPTDPDSGPGTGGTDPRPEDPGDTPPAPPGGFDPAPPVVIDPDGESGPDIPLPGADEAPTDGPDAGSLPGILPLSQPLPPGGGLPLPPVAPGGAGGVPVPGAPGAGGVQLPPELPDSDDGPWYSPGYVDPGGIPAPDGNLDNMIQFPQPIPDGVAAGVPVSSGSSGAFPYETGGSPLRNLKQVDMGEIGQPLVEVPPGSPSGLVLEVYPMPSEIYAETSVLIITSRVENQSYGGTLENAWIQLDLVMPDGRAIYVGQSYRFSLPVGQYYSVSKVIPAHSIWPPGILNVHAVLMVDDLPVGDDIAAVHIFDVPPPELQ